MKALYILGAGGHGKVVAETAAAAGWRHIVLFDDRYPAVTAAAGFAIAGTGAALEQTSPEEAHLAVAIGDNTRRLELIRRYLAAGWSLPVITHPTAWLSPSVQVGAGSVLFAQAAVNAEARLGLGVIVNTGATVDHDCRLGDAVHVSPGAHLGGGVTAGERAWVGIGAAIRHGAAIGAGAIVGAGAAVVSDVPAGVVAVGVPAKVVRHVETD